LREEKARVKKILLLLCFLFVTFLSSICYAQFKFTVIVHEEKDAAKIATEFANTAFIIKNYQKAYLLLSDDTKKSVNFDIFSDAILKMHPTGYPEEVIATEFEPSPGQKGMSIFLKGKNDKEEFYYRFYMVGTKPEGYKVGGFFRGNRAYPPSQLRQPLK